MSGRRIRIVDAGDGRLRLKWTADDRIEWFVILDDFKQTFSGHSERSYSAATKSWSVPLRCRQRLQQWCDYWFDSDCQQWHDADAGRGYGRTYSGSAYGRYSRPEASTSTIADAYARLHLLPSAPPELVHAAHRVMVKLTHPDAGGSHEAATLVNLAWELIEADQAERSKAS